jgi:predicted PurR-regulated permease PerM
MATESFTNSPLFRFTTMMVAASLTVAVFILGKSFLIPFAWSLLIALASVRMLDKLEYKLKVKRIIVTLSFVFLVLIFVILLFYFFYFEVTMIVTGMPEFTEKISDLLHNMAAAFRGYGLSIPDHINKDRIYEFVSEHSGTLTAQLAGFGQGIAKVFLVAIYLFFLIYYRDNYLHYMTLRDKTKKKIRENRKRFNDILDIINNFLYGLLIVTLIMGVMLYIIFLIVGLKFALFFAVLVALLTLIPYLGNPIGMIIVFIFGAITSDGMLTPWLAVGGIVISNMAQENIFKPVIIGDKIKLNAFMIFFSVVIGGLIWGISGMILFMPLIGIIKLLLERNDGTKPLAVLFTHLPKEVRHQFHKEIASEIQSEIESGAEEDKS